MSIIFDKTNVTKFTTDVKIRLVDISTRPEAIVIQGIILNKENNSTIQLTPTVFVHINNQYIALARSNDRSFLLQNRDKFQVGILLLRTYDNKRIYICEDNFSNFSVV